MNAAYPAPERLLRSAGELFAREGFDGVSVRQITSKARTNLGAVTYHFGSKEALFHAVLDRAATRLADRFAEIAAQRGTPLQRIGRIVEMVLTEEDLPAPSMVLRELANDRPLPPPLLNNMQRNIGTLIALISEGQRDGSIRAGEPRLFALSCMAQPFLLRVVGRVPRDVAGLDRTNPDTQRQLVKHVVTTITRSISTSPEHRP